MQADGIDQWDKVYPDRETFESDIAGKTLYVVKSQGICRGLIALDNNQPPEYDHVNWHFHGKNVAVVHRLMIDPIVQGQGLAGYVMDFIEEEARQQGFNVIRRDAFSQNPRAIRLYTKRNYRIAGTVRFRKGMFQCFEKDLHR